MNISTVVLAVSQTPKTICEGDGGFEYLTAADFGGSGGGSTVATVDNIVMQDTNGTLFFKRVSADTPPVLTNWKLSDGSAYTITGTPVPYGVSSVTVNGTVTAITGGLTDTQLRATAVPTTVSGVATASNQASQLTKQDTLIATQHISLTTPPQVVSFTSASSASAVVNAATLKVILTSTSDCWVSIGANPTASNTTGSFFLASGIPSYPITVVGGTDKIAVTQFTSAGSLSIIESY
jgi:hypothetical protein